jgi:hypothetical protein
MLGLSHSRRTSILSASRSPTLKVFDFTRISGGKSSDTAFPDCPYMCPLCRRSLHTQIAVANAILLTIHLKSRAIVIVPADPGKCIVGKILETAAAVGRSRPGFDVHQVLMIPPLFLGNGICCDLSSRPVARFFYERWAGEQQI